MGVKDGCQVILYCAFERTFYKESTEGWLISTKKRGISQWDSLRSHIQSLGPAIIWNIDW